MPARGGSARGALLARSRRSRPRATRSRTRRAARPVADRRRGRLARAARQRGARRRRPRRLRRDARRPGGRPRAGRRAAARACCRRRDAARRGRLRRALQAVAAGELRAAWLPARPPGDRERRLDRRRRTRHGARPAAPRATVDGDSVTLDGTRRLRRPTPPGADLLVAVGATAGGELVAAAVEAAAGGVSVERTWRYDATRALGARRRFDGAQGTRLDVERRGAAAARGTSRRR